MQLSKFTESSLKGKLRICQGSEFLGDDYWDWWIWIEGGDEDLNAIENVIYNLHYTFAEPVRKIDTRENKFMLKTAGWGTFTIYARINMKDGSVVELEHELELHYPDGDEPAKD